MKDVSVIKTALKEAGCDPEDEEAKPINNDGEEQWTADRILEQMEFIGDQITQGAISFLNREYFYLAVFAAVFAVILGVTVDAYEMGRPEGQHATNCPYTAISFLVGASTSILAGYIGMRIAVYTNTRTTFECCKGAELNVVVKGEQTTRKDLKDGFFVAFRGGQVLGFVLVGLALLILEVIIVAFKAAWFDDAIQNVPSGTLEEKKKGQELVRRLFELVAGYGLGGSSVALFGRVGGGIYTKAADVGADLVGKN
jgi:inorganic pyrophosphatase